MRDSERYIEQAEEMERLAVTGSTAQMREGYAALAASYRKLAAEAVHFEQRYGTRQNERR